MIPVAEYKLELLITNLNGQVKGVEKDLDVVKKNVIDVTSKVKELEENGVALKEKDD